MALEKHRVVSNVAAFLNDLSPEARRVVSALRTVIAHVAPCAQESILWGGLSYHRPHVGGRVKGAVCQICVKGGRVRLDFIHGVRLVDPCGLLQGTRLSKRFVPIASVAQAERAQIADLIGEAAALDPNTWS
jgi:hypothetical protein